MSSLKAVEKRVFEDLFGMSSGYVLDFTDARFAEFFHESVGLDIYDKKYGFNGTSKAKHLRAFWEVADDALVGKVLADMLEEWKYHTASNGKPTDTHAFQRASEIVARLCGAAPRSDGGSGKEVLRLKFDGLSTSKIDIDPALAAVLDSRLVEAQNCFPTAPLATIFLCGSILEGLLLGVAYKRPEAFNRAPSAPTESDGKVKRLRHWSLAQLIDVAHVLGILSLDVKKHSHSLRDFRNYIHPRQQLAEQFAPDVHTAGMCLQVLKAAIADLSGLRTEAAT